MTSLLMPSVSARFPELAALDAAATRMEIPCGDGTMVWRRWGEGPPLILLHGGGGAWNHWVRNINALSAVRSVWVPDLPGFGESAVPPEGGDADTLPGYVESGARAAFGDAPCDLVGFSFGGMVAGFLAARMPQRVRRLVLVGTPGMGLSSKVVVDLRSWRRLADPAEREAAHRHNLLQLMLHDAASLDALALALQAENTARDRLKDRKVAFSNALAREMPQIRCPLHGIWGEQDALYTSRHEELRAVLATVPGFRELVFVAGGGHWVQYERAAQFNRTLLRMLGTD